MLVINSNIASLNAIRSQNSNQAQLSTSLQRLSSGLRINSARDDAAGLAISERFQSQIRGKNQAIRNISDGISLLQTSEGALAEINNLIQRGRELAIQAANASVSSGDRAAIQLEIDQLIAEVDRITSTADFNSVKLFEGGDTSVTYDPDSQGLTPEQEQLIADLQASSLAQSEAAIEQYFGIRSDGAALEIKFVEGEGYLAAVSFTGVEVATGKGVNLTLNIDLDDFLPSDGPNGGSSPIENDRIIAHELVHAIAARSFAITEQPLYFIEGTAEFIAGADERLFYDLTNSTGGSTAQKVENLFTTHLNNDGSLEQYSAGYAAVRYLHQAIIAEGGEGIREVFDYLEANTLSTFDDALQALSATYAGLQFSDQSTFEALFNVGGDGNNYVTNLFDSGSLQNTDTGAIGGNDADGGSRDTTANGVIPDTLNATSNPLVYFDENFPSGTRQLLLSSTSTLQFQAGSNSGETISLSLVGLNTGSLGIRDIDLRSNARLALTKFDAALDAINSERARLGAVQNRFESATQSLQTSVENLSAARSRIRDADFAQETAALTRTSIISQAGVAIISQANAIPNIALRLLNA